MRLTTYGTGNGFAPQLVEPVKEALSPLCTQLGGHIEYIDEESSPGNDESVCAVFIGPTDEARRIAQVRYGLAKALEWLEPVLPKATMDEISRIALEAAQQPPVQRPRMAP